MLKLYLHQMLVLVALCGGTLTAWSQPPTFQIPQAAIRVNEASAFFLISLRRESDPGTVTEVNYATKDLTALANGDYLPLSGTIRFEAGETNKTVAIELLDDPLPEPKEQFQLEFTAGPEGQWLGLSAVTVTIEDNDGPGGVDPAFRSPFVPGNPHNFPGNEFVAVKKIVFGLHDQVLLCATNAHGYFSRAQPIDPLFDWVILYPEDKLTTCLPDPRGGLIVAATSSQRLSPIARDLMRFKPFGYDDVAFWSNLPLTGIVNQAIFLPDFSILAGGSFSLGAAQTFSLARISENGVPLGNLSVPFSN
jgi:hypothetical protein